MYHWAENQDWEVLESLFSPLCSFLNADMKMAKLKMKTWEELPDQKSQIYILKWNPIMSVNNKCITQIKSFFKNVGNLQWIKICFLFDSEMKKVRLHSIVLGNFLFLSFRVLVTFAVFKRNKQHTIRSPQREKKIKSQEHKTPKL